jgi:hypothetical protein
MVSKRPFGLGDLPARCLVRGTQSTRTRRGREQISAEGSQNVEIFPPRGVEWSECFLAKSGPVEAESRNRKRNRKYSASVSFSWAQACVSVTETEGAAPSPRPSYTQALEQIRRIGSATRFSPQL